MEMHASAMAPKPPAAGVLRAAALPAYLDMLLQRFSAGLPFARGMAWHGKFQSYSELL